VRSPRVSVVVRSIDRATPGRALASIALQEDMTVEIVLVAASGASHPPVRASCGGFPVAPARSSRPFPRHLDGDAHLQYSLALVRVAVGDPA